MRQITILFLVFISTHHYGQQLRRQADFGILMESPTEEQSQAAGLEAGEGVLIKEVIPLGSANAMEIEIGDILTHFNDKSLKNPDDLNSKLKELRADDEVKVKVFREGKSLDLSGILLAKRKEESGFGDMIYDQVAYKEGHLRSLTIKPELDQETYPAVLFIPSYPCSSIDNIPDWHPYKKLIEILVEQGFAVMRVEKSGMGDSENTIDCDEVNFEADTEAYQKAFEKLLTYDFVDKENVFLFGHGIGGVNAPMVAQGEEINPKGIMVFGTMNSSWMEYMLMIMRQQNPKLGMDYVSLEEAKREYYPLLYQLGVEGKSPKEIAASRPKLADMMKRDLAWNGEDLILGRSHTYWNSLHNTRISKAWSQVNTSVLSLYGSLDLQSGGELDHQEIAAIVNAANPGKGEFHLLPNTMHNLVEAPSEEAGIEAMKDPAKMWNLYQSGFAEKLPFKMIEWMQQRMEE
ncbi:MAG: PDZ domain-containing protein [Bacteroidota bacterium]